MPPREIQGQPDPQSIPIEDNSMSNQEFDPAASLGRLTRREALRHAGTGFGYLALAGLLGRDAGALAATGASPSREHPLAPKAPHFPAKAKRIIFLFMNGAISQMDTWDYKPQLQKDDGKVGPGGGVLTGSKFKFQQYGQTGTWVSELFPHMARHVQLALLHPRPAHRHAGPPRGRDAAPYRHGDRVVDPAVVGRLAPLRAGDGEPGHPRLRDHQPGAQLRRGGQLRQRVPPGPFPGDQDQRQRLHGEPRGPDGPSPCNASRST